MLPNTSFKPEILDESNYEDWKLSFKAFATIKNCAKALTKADDPESANAQAYLSLCVNPNVRRLISSKNSAKDAWDAIAALYSQSTTDRKSVG